MRAFSLSLSLSHDFTWRCNQKKKYKIKQAQLSEVSSWNYVRNWFTLPMRMLGLFESYKSHKLQTYFSILLLITPKWLPRILVRLLIAINQQLRKLKNMAVANACIAEKSWKKNCVEAYVWFGFCFCDNEELTDRSEEYNNIADGESLPPSYLKNGIYVHYREECRYRSVTQMRNGSVHYKIEEECYCQGRP